jgi:hypothetical protein
MRRVVELCCSVLLIACAQQDQQAESESAPATPAAISLADVAGTWNMETAAMESDSILVTSQLVATATTEGWTLNLPGRDPVPVRVLSVGGDSIVTEMGPFPSVLREGVMVTTYSVSRLRDSLMIGTLTARYEGAGADSVATLRTRARRAN